VQGFLIKKSILEVRSAFRRNAIFIKFIENYRYQSYGLIDELILISTQILLLKKKIFTINNLIRKTNRLQTNLIINFTQP